MMESFLAKMHTQPQQEAENISYIGFEWFTAIVVPLAAQEDYLELIKRVEICQLFFMPWKHGDNR